MTFYKHFALLFLSILFQSGVYESAAIKRDNESIISSGLNGDSIFDKNFFGGTEEKNLESEILEELNHLSSRKQREIFNDLEKQQKKFNVSSKNLVLSEQENLSPLNVEELKTIRKTIKSSNNSIPAIRSKRTLNFLLYAVARAMGYTLTPSNPDAEWIPRQQPPSGQPLPQPCSTPSPPCRPNPPSTPPPCRMPPTPPCPGSGAVMQAPTIPPNQIDANTISYPYRPARTIPLLNFAPLPAGIRVPYPPLLQPPNQQRSSCPPQQPTPPPCAGPPSPSPPPCTTTPSPKPSPPCKPMTSTPPPCNTPAPPPPPCGTTPAPMPPPCATTPAPPPPCNPTPPPCTTTTPRPPPCATPPSPPPPPSPCGNPSTENPPSKKGSIVLEYDDPVRIQIFSNGKKYLPASDNIFSGWNDDAKDELHSYPVSDNESGGNKGEDYEEKEETEEEHIEEEEEDDSPEQGHYEEEKDSATVNDDENESETSLSVVKKPAEKDLQKVNQRRLVSTKTNKSDKNDIDNSKKESSAESESTEKSLKMKKPKKKKWVRIVKKQRRKTKTDSNSHSSFPHYSSDSFPESSRSFPKLYGEKDSHFGFDSLEKDVSDYSGDSSSHSSEDVTQIDLKKVRVNDRELHLPDAVDNRRYEFNINPYALEPESERRKKLEKAVERYVENYVEKQLGQELIKNTGIPKTTVFEFAPKNGPKIQTITTTVAKTSSSASPINFKPQIKTEASFPYTAPRRNAHATRSSSHREVFNRRGDASYEAFTLHK